jgi:hypothetical protein
VSFLFPLYLLGALAVGIPILLHLRRRPPKDHVEFSSLMFLEKTPERLTRRTRIERWLLLALRCLALILLALMFGRPFLRSTAIAPDGDGGKRIVVLVDASASMRREDLWARALTEAADALAKTRATDEVAVAIFDEKARVMRDFTALANLPGQARAESFRQALNEAKIDRPGWRSTRLGDVLIEAAGLIADAGSRRELEDQEIVVIGDFQEGAERDSLNRYAWPEDVSVRPVMVGVTKSPDNLSLHLVAPGNDDDGNPETKKSEAKGDENRAARRRARLTNGRDSEGERFSLIWEGMPQSKIEGFLPAGASRVMPVPPRADETADSVLAISGDGHDFDNRVYLARAQPRPVDILFLGRDAKLDDVGSPLFYLSRAMHRTAAIDPSVSAMTFEEFAGQPDRLKAAQVVVVRAEATTPADLGKTLGDFAKAGGLVIAIANEGAGADFLSRATGIADLGVKEAEVRDYAMLSGLDFEHPILAPFAQAQIRDFTKIHTWKHREVTIPEAAVDQARVFARYDGGAPAWMEIPAGTGRVYVFSSGWEPRESQLALSSKFVPLLYAMLGQAGFSAIAEPTRYVGDAIPLPVNETDLVVTGPDGLKAAPPSGEAAFSATESPGFYTVTSRDALGRDQSRVYAINLRPGESRTGVTDPAVSLTEFGVRLSIDTASATAAAAPDPALLSEAQKRRLEAEEKEANQKLWKWFVVAALAILLLETLLAGRRRGIPAAEQAATA